MAFSKVIFVVLLAGIGLAFGQTTKSTTTSTSTTGSQNWYNPWYYPNYNYGWGYPWGLGYYGMFPNYGTRMIPQQFPHFPYYYGLAPHVSTSHVTHHAPVVHHPTHVTNTVTSHAPYALPSPLYAPYSAYV